MAKRPDDFDAAMREIAAQRDRLVEERKPVTIERLERLQSCLVSEFLVETALSDAARQRDEMLSDRAPVIQAFVEAALAERLLALAEDEHPRRSLAHYGKIGKAVWRLIHPPRPLELAATIALLAAGLVLVSHLRSRSTRTEVSNEPRMLASPDAMTTDGIAHRARLVRVGDSFFSESTNQLTLRVSTTELALLQPSLLTARYLPDRYDAGLPLDLPVRQSLMDAESSRTP